MKTNHSEEERLRFPTNRGLILYFLRGSIRYFIAGAVFACLVALFDLIIPRLIQVTVDVVIGGKLGGLPSWMLAALGRMGDLSRMQEQLRTHLWLAAAAVALAAVAGAVSRYAFRVCNEKGAELFVQRTRDELFRQILSLPYAWQGENSAGDIIQRCTSDVETIKIFVSEQLTSLLHVFVLIFMSLYFMVTIQPKLTAAAAIFIPIMIISSIIFYGLIGDEFEKVDSEEGHLSAIAQENLTGVRVVRTFGRERFERERFEAQNEHYTNHWIRLMRVLAGFWVSGNVIATTRNMTVAVFGAVLCVRGELTAGGMIAFLSYNALMSLPIRRIGRVIADMSKTGVSMDRLRYIMNAVPEDEVVPEDAAVPESAACPEKEGEMPADRRYAPLDRDIEFSHVSFRYKEGAPEILRDVSMTIRAGTTVGILGATGSGKSTLVQLLDRLWELPPESGKITIGGVDLRDMDRGWLRKNIGMVLQEPYLFSRTLAENIAIAMPPLQERGKNEITETVRKAAQTEAAGKAKSAGAAGIAESVGAAGKTGAGKEAGKAEYTEAAGIAEQTGTIRETEYVTEEIRRAAQIACLDEAIDKFADGYDTFVGERGVTLSGGQKQRAAIAQMLVRRTPVMIFDDSLSSVDAETDARIRRALQENTGNATVILIAHRITTLQQADEIFVLDRGRIAEHGRHEELLAQGGIYSRVYALQIGVEEAV
ncbi:MAG: ABC transporter ATP-binding protein [Eubacteriales bacterium]|nr:ABC transporter ATP-binding protein [Eubacteriales bacterium]